MCTLERNGQVFILTLTGDGEHRLSLDLIARIHSALAEVRAQSMKFPFSALVTRAEGKYFCSGFDLSFNEAKSPSNASNNMRQWNQWHTLMCGLTSITADLMSLQMPTICAVTGESSAVGFMLAFSHDYVAMHAEHGFLCMTDQCSILCYRYFRSMMKAKVRDFGVFKDLVMHARKIPAIEAMEKGVIDFVGETASETAEVAVKLGQMLARKNWNGQVYASLRKEAYPEICLAISK